MRTNKQKKFFGHNIYKHTNMYDMIKILYTITNPFITSQQSLTITILHILKYKFVYSRY